MLPILYLVFRRNLSFHLFLMGLCSWSVYVQLQYRIPGNFISILLPLVSISAGCLSAVFLITRLMGRSPIEEPFRGIFDFVERWGARLILAFGCYGIFVLVNARWDASLPMTHTTEIVEISAGEINVWRSIPYAWTRFRSWRTPQETESMFLHYKEQDALWPGQAIVMQVRRGYFNVAWVAKVEPDEEKRLLSIVTSISTASKAWRELTDLYVKQNRWPDVKRTAAEYLKLNPADSGFALYMGPTFISARRFDDAISLLKPVADNTFNHELYLQLGFALAMAGRKPEGIKFINKAIEAAPDNYRGYYILGKAHLRTGEHAAAIPPYEKALRLRPYYPEVEDDLRQLRSVLAEQKDEGNKK